MPQQRRRTFDERDQARRDATMLPRVLHLKEVALLLYRSIARGEPSWARGPRGGPRRTLSRLPPFAAPLSRHPPHPFLSLALSCVSARPPGPPHAVLPPLSFVSSPSSQLAYFGKVKTAGGAEPRKNGERNGARERRRKSAKKKERIES